MDKIRKYIKFKSLQNYKPVYISLLILVLIYIVFTAYKRGHDIDVYLHASVQLFNKADIYAPSTYNNYLYSPLFALLLRPISILDFSYARVIWALINLIVAVRLWGITSRLIKESLEVDSKLIIAWTMGVLLISFGFLNLNLKLGQITIIILWLTFEGLYQIIIRNKIPLGAMLLALGITIKIIPAIGLFYLFFKGKIKAITVCIAFVAVGLFLPSIIIGQDYNLQLLQKWAETINPSNSKYVFEDYNKGTQSLNAILPTYFYDSERAAQAPTQLNHQIAAIPYDTLVLMMQIVRVVVVFSTLLLIFYRFKRRQNKAMYFYWEFSYLALVSALIFPHQQKYSMLYFVPAGAYMVLFIALVFRLKWRVEFKEKLIAIIASFLLFLIAIQGRDIIGAYLFGLFEYLKFYGLINIVFLIFLLLIKPDALMSMKKKSSLPTYSETAS